MMVLKHCRHQILQILKTLDLEDGDRESMGLQANNFIFPEPQSQSRDTDKFSCT